MGRDSTALKAFFTTIDRVSVFISSSGISHCPYSQLSSPLPLPVNMNGAQGSESVPSPEVAGSSKQELCLLAIDGGGVRGLSSLYILKRLMESINSKTPP